jgi:hypothetical protein
MKRIGLILILIMLSCRLFAPAERIVYVIIPEAINPFIPLWDAVKMVETGNNADTINYLEQAYGSGQIRWSKLKDFNDATGRNYTLEDCLREPVSREIFLWHCSAYYDIETAAMKWNGSGPMTVEYWKKVKKELFTNKN